ncbi:MAG: hypothetical protein MN733_11705, partial [Nitrososphaera sp.]|nr:hypothetical protein [Nitrososphaera sp.]
MSDRHGALSRNNDPMGLKYQRWLAFMALGLLFMPVLPFLVPANATSSSVQLEETEFQLAVEPAAPKLPANRQAYYAMFQLQVVDTGNPIEAPHDLAITLISSDPSVVSLPQDKMTLKAGDSMIKGELLTTDKAGIASITALAEGVKSATASMTTYRMDSLEPTRLALNAAPSSFIADPKYTGMIYIQVLNSQNLPAVSKNDIAVDLSSSNPTVGKVPSYVVIPPGKSGVLVDFTPEKQTGQTQLRASAPGLAPGELSVAVSSPVATKLLVEFAPDVIPAINYYDSIMTVQLTDQSDLPVNTARNINVLLKSSDTTVVQVPPSIVIPAGRSYASVVVEAKGSLGLATVTATASGYETGFNTLEAVKLSNATTSDPKVLQLYTVPSVLPPDNSEHQAIIVAFRDENG